jgi:hypothetical protein
MLLQRTAKVISTMAVRLDFERHDVICWQFHQEKFSFSLRITAYKTTSCTPQSSRIGAKEKAFCIRILRIARIQAIRLLIRAIRQIRIPL